MKLKLKNLSIGKINGVLITAVLSILVVWSIQKGVLSSASSAEVKKHASVYFPVKSHDFGKVTGAKTVSHKFIFYNRGGDILLIKKITAG